MLYLSLLQSWQVSTGVGILFAVVIFILGNPMYEAAIHAVGNAHIHVYKVVHIFVDWAESMWRMCAYNAPPLKSKLF